MAGLLIGIALVAALGWAVHRSGWYDRLHAARNGRADARRGIPASGTPPVFEAYRSAGERDCRKIEGEWSRRDGKIQAEMVQAGRDVELLAPRVQRAREACDQARQAFEVKHGNA